jgi:trehalose 6-phosphate phosphatase
MRPTAPTTSPLAPPAPLEPAAAALFLDLDGTLAPIEPRPDAVGPDPRRSRILKRLQAALGGRLAVVSGRSLADVDRILEGVVACVSGVHGLERRTSRGEVLRAAPHPGLEAARQALAAFAAVRPGLMVEDKGLSLALHYRRAPGAGPAARAEASRLAERLGLAVQHGDMVAEARTPGADKGQALAAFMAEPPFTGFRPVFVGDDLTDEHAFARATELGGFGVLVGPERASAARYRLEGVAEALDWLEAAV